MITLEYASSHKGFLNVWFFFLILFNIFDDSDLLFSGFPASCFLVKISKDKIYKYCLPKWRGFLSKFRMKCERLLILPQKKFVLYKKFYLLFVGCLSNHTMHYANKNLSCICRFINILDRFEWNLKYVSKDSSVLKQLNIFHLRN